MLQLSACPRSKHSIYAINRSRSANSMAKIPFIGRLNPAEYMALVGSFILVGLEAFVRLFTLALPSSVITLLYRASRRLFNRFTTPATRRSENVNNVESTFIANAVDFAEICGFFGYYAEEHVVRTGDGYLLGLHRLGWRKGEEDQKVNSGPGSITKPVVYLHHGLMMNSEVWCCLTDEQRCLPFRLVEKGYDVWFGNNRGNKYSKKSVHHSPTDPAFWDFSIDEFAFHDIPDSVSYILSTTSAASLSYIGFSQGTAQAFATLAVHPKLNEQINCFIALAPAMSPAGLSNGVVDALVKASPQVLFLMFGRRSIFSSALMWQNILYPPIFVRVIDLGLGFLFGWKTNNMSMSQKLAAYPRLYSYASTKSVVHWFQIIRNKSFQMYDDDVQPVVSGGRRSTKVARFPTRNIKTPIVLLYGGSDSLVDIDVMLKELPPHTIAIEVPHYEHLDFLWAEEVDSLVFPHVFNALESFSSTDHTREEYARYRIAHHQSLGAISSSALLGTASDDEANGDSSSRQNVSAIPRLQHRAMDGANDAAISPQGTPPDPYKPFDQARKRTQLSENVYDDSSDASSPRSSTARSEHRDHASTTTSTTPNSTPVLANSKIKTAARSTSGATSTLGFEHASGKPGSRGGASTGSGGITVGASRPVGGGISRGEVALGSVTVPAHHVLGAVGGGVSEDEVGKKGAAKKKAGRKSKV